MDMLGFIERKRDGGVHPAEEIRRFVTSFASGEVPDYQAAAWLMAVFFNGLSDEELGEFTLALARSGRVLSFGGDLFLVDKHSTGGVGDKISLLLVPLAAACGLSVAKLSGPGLGFTGGTVDKLEAIPGFRTHLSSEEFLRQVKEIGCAISGHSADLAPAEGKFYSLRDVTGTVPSLPLICSSIVSKKIAGGADAFVFDVKCGSGAFMKDYGSAEKLAEALVSLSKKLGKKAMALVTDMDQPLGEWVGNAVEVLEAVLVLRGGGPADVREVTVSLAGAMVSLGKGVSFEDGCALAAEKLDDGSALEKMKALVEAQGGKGQVCGAPETVLSVAPEKAFVKAMSGGTVTRIDARAVGEGVKRLGGGRMSLGDPIDLSVGVRMIAKTGAAVSAGDALLEIRYGSEEKLEDALPFFEKAFSVEETAMNSPHCGEGKKRSFVLGTIR
ncbi:thymidine phosphorylase [Aminivibrio sp.]|jgi:pyrimidine-nucleoside phosphorylase|uniref:thymidine phosphorylase n=1 Tax=Aminivibrio sp. TaxID=1872489 RepID=UPI001A50EE15|nr:thymidine phosphorylase [Aminivibrio sp.]MBL3539291.1 thymidine phosphorylase [Aminivibrio sp.]MDK2959041.1 pyrimidine-nucleoside phosphorylase [Synergistaceae bacterium]